MYDSVRSFVELRVCLQGKLIITVVLLNELTCVSRHRRCRRQRPPPCRWDDTPHVLGQCVLVVVGVVTVVLQLSI